MSTLTNNLSDWLPRGGGIPHQTWVSRHRWVTRILAVQCIALAIFAFARGSSFGASVPDLLLPCAMVVFARSERLSKTQRSAAAAIGLMGISTGLVHLSDGYIEAHFHFFAMIPIVAMYESWVPFTLSVGMVLFHHGVAGSLTPAEVYNHPSAVANPWLWAGVHALGISAMCVAAVVNWRAHEGAREAESDMASQLLYQANHDPLTGLPSRALFIDRLEQALKANGRTGRCASVLMLDMDGFKEVNDVFGHACGDAVLVEVAQRLTARVRAVDTVTRMGGDEFAVLLVDADADQADQTATRLAEALARPYDLGGASVDLEVSIGIATAAAGDEATVITRNADIAMYHAKEQRLGKAHFEQEQQAHGGTRTGNRLDLLGDLRRALQEHEIVLHYQPKVDITTGRMVGVEALARWQHPTRGLLQPADFIEIVERTNLSRPFTAEVLSIALTQARRWSDQGVQVPVAVNLSRRSLLDPSFPGAVVASLAEHGVPAHLLVLEITEMTIVSDPELAIQILRQLRTLGVKMSLDDFGTGYSSLSYLKNLPIDELKIDRSFVRHLAEEGSRDSILVRGTVELAHSLGLSVVAEGVESADAEHQLGTLQCDVGQGFYFAPPMPATELDTWLLGAPTSEHLALATPLPSSLEPTGR